jgi:hypothetical protein
VLADAIIQYTQLALQLANLTATSQATLVQTPVKKKTPTGGKVGRPRATEKIAKTNTKMDDFYRRKPTQSDATMPLQASARTPVEEVKEPVEEERKQHMSYLRPQSFEEPPHESESLLTAKKSDQQQRGIQMAVDMRKDKKREILTKKRYPQGQSQ